MQEISSNVGADPSIVNTAIQTALPMLLNGLANNASTPDGAESLNNALEQHHDGSILDNIGGLAGMIFGGGQGNAASPAADAGGILGHILGSDQGAVAQQVSQQSGLGTGQVAQILMFLAPIVMGYLGRQKASRALTPAAWADFSAGFWAGSTGAAGSTGNSMLDMASKMLDHDHDGSAIDDIASMAFKYFSK